MSYPQGRLGLGSFAMQTFPVTSDIWCLRRRSYLTCSYLVRTTSGIVLVDAGMDSAGEDVRRALRAAFGATPADVRAILLTHWHNDHAAGAAMTVERSSARVYYHAGDEPQLTRASASTGLKAWAAARIPELGPLVLFKGLWGEATPRAVRADRLVTDGEVLAEEFEVIETPGHTPGHLAFYHRPARALFAGDALAVIAGRVRSMARSVTPDLVAAHASMLKLLDRPIEILCPGHREPMIEARARCDARLAELRANPRWRLLG